MTRSEGPDDDLRIEAYPDQPAHFSPHDPDSFEVAGKVAALIRKGHEYLRVEHIGSTAVPTCPGKGIVDFILVYPVGELEKAKGRLLELGFQPQRHGEPFPETRPMRIGAVRHNGKLYRLHVHVLSADSQEVVDLCGFRDRLRQDKELLERYAARKKEIIADGVTDPLSYTKAKAAFFKKD